MCHVYQNLLLKKSDKNSNVDTPLQQYHSAMKVIFQMFDDAVRQFKNNKITVTLGGTVKKVYIVPVLLYMKGDHASHQKNTCRFGHANGTICISCNRAPAWDADNAKQEIGEQIDATFLHEQNVEYSNITERINLLNELIAVPECEDILKKKKELETNSSSLRLLKEKFDGHSITPNINAFKEFSQLATSIYHCSPPDHLHVFLLGVLKYAADSTIGTWSDTTKNQFEILARKIIDEDFVIYPKSISTISNETWTIKSKCCFRNRVGWILVHNFNCWKDTRRIIISRTNIQCLL